MTEQEQMAILDCETSRLTAGTKGPSTFKVTFREPWKSPHLPDVEYQIQLVKNGPVITGSFTGDSMGTTMTPRPGRRLLTPGPRIFDDFLRQQGAILHKLNQSKQNELSKQDYEIQG